MSNNAVPKDEPSTTAKVIIATNSGQLEVELWAKQIPLACRNFIQLAMEGYYDGTIFHRMIPGFMIQGGDPTGTGTGGESIYGAPFKDQFHQRIKFGRRGLVAMANTGKDSNNSQFFITFDQTPHLNKKHTIFGKVVGDSIYKLLQFQSLETNKEDRPMYPPTIRKIRVVLNPFDDIIPRSSKKNEQTKQDKHQSEQQQKKIKKNQIKKLKNKNKLTFEEDGADQDDAVDKIKSSHDTLNDDKLLKKVAVTQQQLERKRKAKLQQKQKVKQVAKKIHQPENQQNIEGIGSIVKAQLLKKKKNAQGNISSQVTDEVLNYKKKLNRETGKVQIVWEDNSEQQNQQNNNDNDENAKMEKLRELQQQQYEALRADELNFKKLKEGSAKQRRKQLVAEEKTLLSNAQKKRYEYLKKNHVEKRESDVMSRLKKFTDRLVQSNPGDWMCHSLKFHIDSQNAYSMDKKNQQNKGRHDDEDDGGLKIEYNNNHIDNDEINIEELYELAAREDQNQNQDQNA